MKGLLYLALLALVAFVAVPRIVAWLRTLQSAPVPIGFGGRAP